MNVGLTLEILSGSEWLQPSTTKWFRSPALEQKNEKDEGTVFAGGVRRTDGQKLEGTM